MQADQIEDDVARQLSLTQAPNLSVQRQWSRPTASAPLCATGRAGEQSQTVPAGAAFVLLVALAPMEAGKIRIERRPETLLAAGPGNTFVSASATSSIAGFAGPYDFLQFHLPTATLDRPADDQSLARGRALHMMPPNDWDPAMQMPVLSLLPGPEVPQTGTTRFLDAVARALHAHITRSDGGTPASRSYTGPALAPWQLRRVRAFVDDNLDGDLSTADLAAACSLSPSHFARAFSASTGTSPHKWLINRRIERAKALMLGGGDGLSQIALACGFVDQSHFTRVFARSEGESPGRWRRRNRTCNPPEDSALRRLSSAAPHHSR